MHAPEREAVRGDHTSAGGGAAPTLAATRIPVRRLNFMSLASDEGEQGSVERKDLTDC